MAKVMGAAIFLRVSGLQPKARVRSNGAIPSVQPHPDILEFFIMKNCNLKLSITICKNIAGKPSARVEEVSSTCARFPVFAR
jgi:hypothetical protein